MRFDFSKKAYVLGAGAAIIGASFFLGGYLGYKYRPEIDRVASVYNKEPAVPLEAQVDFSPFWKAWRAIEEKYVSSDGLERQKMLWGSIEGLAKSLDDPYTVFFPPAEKEIFESEIRGDFEGVGMEIGIRKDILTVISPLNGTPAWRAGVKAGDKILKIDDQTSEIKVVRDKIEIPLIETEKKEGGIFIIRLFSFSEKSSSAFRQALREMVESGSDKLILDLRNNPGGYLEAAVDISSWFLPPGKTVVKENFRDKNENVHRSKGYNIFGNMPVAVLVNGGSASASEIVAGALQDHGAAKIVGVKTSGKGSVQELVPITPATSLKITIARWLTPLGRSISEAGIEPDVVVEPAKEDDESIDPQLDKAIEIVKG